MSQQPGSAGNDGGGKRPRDDTGADWNATALLLARVMGIGWLIGGSIALGAGVGWWLDNRLDTSPLLTLVGLVIGVISAFLAMIRLLRAFGGSSKR